MAKIGILRLKSLVDALLEFVKEDYKAKVLLQSQVVPPSTANYIAESFLYRCIDSSDIADGVDYRLLAVEIFTREQSDSRKIETRLMFDRDRANLPTIHVREPAKNKGVQDGLGYIDEEIFENIDESFNESRRRSFNSQYDLMITSMNRHEVIVIEEVLLGLLISAQDNLSLSDPFYQFNFNVKELMANNELVPQPLFIKSIGVNVSYDKTYPNLSGNSLLNDILFSHNLLTS